MKGHAEIGADRSYPTSWRSKCHMAQVPEGTGLGVELRRLGSPHATHSHVQLELSLLHALKVPALNLLQDQCRIAPAVELDALRELELAFPNPLGGAACTLTMRWRMLSAARRWRCPQDRP